MFSIKRCKYTPRHIELLQEKTSGFFSWMNTETRTRRRATKNPTEKSRHCLKKRQLKGDEMRCYNHSREVFNHEKIEIFDGSHEPRAAIHKKSAELCSVVADCPAQLFLNGATSVYTVPPSLSDWRKYQLIIIYLSRVCVKICRGSNKSVFTHVEYHVQFKV